MERHLRTSSRLFFLGLLLSFASAATGRDDSRFPGGGDSGLGGGFPSSPEALAA